MTFELWAALHKEWGRRPPVHWLVAWALGYKPPEAQPKPMDAAAALDWFQRTGGVIPGVGPAGAPPGHGGAPS